MPAKLNAEALWGRAEQLVTDAQARFADRKSGERGALKRAHVVAGLVSAIPLPGIQPALAPVALKAASEIAAWALKKHIWPARKRLTRIPKLLKQIEELKAEVAALKARLKEAQKVPAPKPEKPSSKPPRKSTKKK